MSKPKSLFWRVSLSYAALSLAIAGLVVLLSAVAQGRPQGVFVASVAAIGLVAAAVSIGLAYLLVRRTSMSIASFASSADSLAAGDLDREQIRSLAAESTEELAAAFIRMSEAIRATVRDLSGERNKLTAVLDTMADGIVVVEADSRVSLMNQAAQLLLDVRTTEIQGTPLSEIARDHELLELVSSSLQSYEMRQAHLELLRQRRLVSAIAVPLGGDGEGVLLSLHDLTAFRQLETTRREFVSNVSHELRSPLASIRSMIETLSGGALDDRQTAADFVARIEQDVRRMDTLVSELLELSRLESGQIALDLRPLSLKPIAADTAAAFHDRSTGLGVDVSIEIPDDLPLVSGESEKIGQVLTNLMDNALKFTPPGGRITMSALPDHRNVIARVSNTGDGIAPEHLPHLFERFYKVDRSRRDLGTGLGLAIVKHIVLAHGGEVDVQSSLGEGATFTFTLPRAS